MLYMWSEQLQWQFQRLTVENLKGGQISEISCKSSTVQLCQHDWPILEYDKSEYLEDAGMSKGKRVYAKAKVTDRY